jgi:hypothetical protein
VGGGPTALPGLGFMVEGGKYLGRSFLGAAVYMETSLHYQDMYDEFNNAKDENNSSFAMWNLGVKAVLRPECSLRPVLRGGIGWTHVAGWDPNASDIDIGELNSARDAFGGYAGIGLETDLFGGRITTGPEVRWGSYISPEGGAANHVPMILWHFVVNL